MTLTFLALFLTPPSDQGCLWLGQNLQVHILDQHVTEKVTEGEEPHTKASFKYVCLK